MQLNNTLLAERFDNSGTATIAKFFIGNGGDVLAFYDPTGFSSLAGLAGRSRWTGSAVRLK